MKNKTIFSVIMVMTAIAALLMVSSCSSPKKDTTVEENIKKYTHIWDEIMNKRNLEMFSDSNFTTDVIMHASPTNIVGIDSARAFYANYLTGFSNIQFAINDAFGQDEKLVKYWTFKGTHTGNFFGIPPTGKTVDVEGVTLVRMISGKIAEEKDFFDNLEFLQQLGLLPR